MKKRLITTRNYDFLEVASSLQKAIRRQDHALAGYFALELWHSGFHQYVWKRLLTISAEDCYGIVTREIWALYEACEMINKNTQKGGQRKGRIFLSKAVMILCDTTKNRDPDHLQNYIYDKKMIDSEKIDKAFEDSRETIKEIPEYAYDCHTATGKRMGMTKEQFMKDELNSLKPRQKGLFDNVVE